MSINKVLAFAVMMHFMSASVYAEIEVPEFYKSVSKKYSIPPALLFAVAMQESKPPRIKEIKKPWPWTLNCAGQGYYFATRKEAGSFATKKIKSGVNCDLGIMQISSRWNLYRFESIESAMDPYVNIDVGAQILSEHYKQTGSWNDSVGRYHSPSNKQRAKRYTNGVRTQLGMILGVKTF